MPPGRPTGSVNLIDTGMSCKAPVDPHFMPTRRGLGAHTAPVPAATS
jgi:hypothetical protein